MMHPRVTLELDDDARTFSPGDVLSGQFSLHGVFEHDVRAIELSVLWHTEGKGEEDMSVHYFECIEPRHGETADFRQPRQFNTILPNSPLSYRGLIVNICWYVRVRVFLMRGKALVLDVPFQLGAVPRPQRVVT